MIIEALLSSTPQPKSDDGFDLHRIGDAVANRGIHTAIYEALRLCQLL